MAPMNLGRSRCLAGVNKALRAFLAPFGLVALVALAGITAPALADGSEPAPKVVVIDSTKVYFGNAAKYKVPAIVDSQQVYAEIPAYKYIVENGLTEEDPMYWFKMKEASKVFSKALQKLNQKKGFDLVGEIDALYREDGESLPDVTETVKELVPEVSG